MFPIIHFIASLVLGVILYPFFGFWSLAVFIGGFFIDIDHYLWWIIERRNFNLIKSYREIKKNIFKRKDKVSKIGKRPLYSKEDMLHIFHVWEFWVLMFLLTFIHKFFFIVFLGMILHLGMDFIDMFKSRIYGLRAISYFGWLKRHKN